MFQFTTTNVINSNLDSNGKTAKYAGTATEFKVTRVNTFKKANIVSVYKRPYQAGVKEVATIVLPSTTAGKVVRLSLDVRLSQDTNSEYANFYIQFKKPVVVEVIATGTVDTDGAALVEALNSMKDRFGTSYIKGSYDADTNTITLEATEFTQRFYAIEISEEAASYNSIIQPEYTILANTFTVTTPGKNGFGTDEYMVKAIRLQTLDNLRPFGISREELPVMGGNYTQYTIKYSVPNTWDMGIVSGSTSITEHVFYVKSDLVSTFEAAISNVGVSIDTIGLTVTAITVGTNLIDISNVLTTPQQLTYTSTTPAGGTGAVWALTGVNTIAGSLDATKVTLTGSGLFSLATGHGIAAGDKVGVSVTIDGFTQTADLTFQA